MIPGRVSLVAIVSVAWILRVEVAHQTIARDLGHDRRGRDGCRPAVAADDRPLREQEIGNAESVDEHEPGKRGELHDRLQHGQERCTMDIDAVDFVDADDRHAPDHGGRSNVAVEALTIRSAQDLRICHAAHVPGRIEHHGSGDDRAGKTAPPDFVDTGDMDKALPPDVVFNRP